MKNLFLILALTIATDISFAQGNRIWSTYYGGTQNECSPVGGPYVATDPNGNVFLGGYTYSSAGIASGGYQNTFGGGTIDAYVVKFDASGNRLWATYIGGDGADYIYGLCTDAFGNVYAVGKTTSTTNIGFGGFQNSIAGNFDAFVTKISASGTLIWSTYYGDTGADGAGGVCVDVNGNIYVTGNSNSTSNIASGGFQNTNAGAYDAFLVKFNAAGNRLWATYYGGLASEAGNAAALDPSGNVYIGGYTGSSSGIFFNGHQSTYGGLTDAFLTKFDPLGNLLWSTYYGGNLGELGTGIGVNSSREVYLCGSSKSTSAIATNGCKNVYAGGTSQGDAYLVKFDSLGVRLWGTYFGGPGEDYANGLSLDNSGNIYIGGDTYSSSGISLGGFQNNLQGLENEFIAKFSSECGLLCATYFGVNHDEDGRVCTDNNGNVYLAGATNSVATIAFNGFQNTFGGGGTDSYLAKFSTTCSTTGFDNVSLIEFANIYPNPSNGKFTLKLNGTHSGELVIVNAIGQKVYSICLTEYTDVLSCVLPDGIYNVLIISSNLTLNAGKLIIN